MQNEVSPLTIYAAIAQLVERFHGKEEVSGSNPDRGSKLDFSTTESPSRAAFSVAARNACAGKPALAPPEKPFAFLRFPPAVFYFFS